MQSILKELAKIDTVLTQDELLKLSDNIQSIKDYVDYHDCKEDRSIVPNKDMSDSVKRRLIELDLEYYTLLENPSKELTEYAFMLYQGLSSPIIYNDEPKIDYDELLEELIKNPKLYDDKFPLDVKIKFIKADMSNLSLVNAYDDDYDKICEAAIDISFNAMKYMTPLFFAQVEYAYRINKNALAYVPRENYRILSHFLTIDPMNIYNCHLPTHEMEMFAIQLDPTVIIHTPSRFRTDTVISVLNRYPALYPHLKCTYKRFITFQHRWKYLKYKYDCWIRKVN